MLLVFNNCTIVSLIASAGEKLISLATECELVNTVYDYLFFNPQERVNAQRHVNQR